MSGLADVRQGADRFFADTGRRRLAYSLVAIVLAALCLWPQPFVGRAKLVPQSPSSPLGSMLSSGGGGLQDLAALFGGGRRAIDLYLTIGQSADVRNDVIRNLRLVGPTARYATMQAAQKGIEGKVEVQSLPGGVIEIEVTTHDAEESLQLTRSFATALGKRLKILNQQQVSTKESLVTSRSREASARLAAAEAALREFRKRNRISADPAAELGAAIAVRSGLEANLQGKLVELQTLEGFLGPENPRLLTLRAQIAELRNRIAQSVTPEANAGGPNAGGLTELSTEYLNLYRDYLFAQQIYQVYTRLAEEIAVEELSGQTAATVQMIEDPHVDAWRHYNVWAIALLALLGLSFFFTEFYAPATGIVLWRSERLSVT